MIRPRATLDTVRADPNAAYLVESLRAFGYDFPTAIADLVDNSIAATATNVWIEFVWNGEQSTVSIRDDGKGMSAKRLLDAMRLGSTNPLSTRASDDLGRFGLGLKTASLSQCKLVGVRTKEFGGMPAELCWDLNLVRETNDWLVRKSLPASLAEKTQELDRATSGTIVVWGQLDRVLGDARVEDNVGIREHFYATADHTCQHLQETFCDYLRQGELAIHVNGRSLRTWDPFLEKHVATQTLPLELLKLSNEPVRILSYVLPHHSKLSEAEYQLAAGGKDWLGRQGFYVFRNRRLLLGGSWLGLGFQKERHHELARIRIDITNANDSHWHLDVKKSNATPPPELRGQLKRVARLVRAAAARVYRHRGSRLVPRVDSERKLVWLPHRRHGKNFYRVDREHPVLLAVRDSCSNESAFNALIKLMEETIPTPLIAINEAEEPKGHGAPFEGVRESEVLVVMRAVYQAMIANGQTPQDARRRLAYIDPFYRFPELLETFSPG